MVYSRFSFKLFKQIMVTFVNIWLSDLVILTRNFKMVEICSHSQLLVQNRFTGLWPLDKLISIHGLNHIHVLYLPTSVSEIFEVLSTVSDTNYILLICLILFKRLDQ